MSVLLPQSQLIAYLSVTDEGVGAAAWSDITGATSDTYKPAATINDGTLFRMGTIKWYRFFEINALAVTYALPTSCKGLHALMRHSTEYEYELDYGPLSLWLLVPLWD